MGRPINTAERYRAAYEARRAVLTTREAGAMLGRTADQVIGLIRSGVLPGYQDGERGQWRIKRADVESLLSGQPADNAPRLQAEQSVRLVAELTPEQMQALAMGAPVVIEIRRRSA